MRTDTVTLDHGGGGRASRELIETFFLPHFSNPVLEAMDDSAVVELAACRTAMTTDSYVVDPIFFPGGDIGRLAICGTVNDLSAQGALPLYLSAAFILEEGLALQDLKKILRSMAEAAREAGVIVVTGDTKVVPRGKADKIFITTTGVGAIPEGVHLSGGGARPGDKILLNGTIGDHGIAVLSRREGLSFEGELESDAAPLNRLVEAILQGTLDETRRIHTMRDPTRGGLAASLNEIAGRSHVGIRIDEGAVPIREPVRAACEILGLDPLAIANEGKILVFVAPEEADRVLDRMKRNRYGQEACIIGETGTDHPGKVFMSTKVGGTRIIDLPLGEPLPRIC